VNTTYLYTSSAISNQIDFEGKSFLEKLLPIEAHKSLIEPVYKQYINPMTMRRMSKAAKMAIACSFQCLEKIEDKKLDAIIIGTALGSIADTEKFLKISTTIESKILPPTAFIQSGHNTIAGQIALLLKNDAYNMTHVQQGLSFEHSLLDAMLTISEGKQLVLTGAVDENIPLLNEIANRFELNEAIINQISEGASFFLMGPDKTKAKAKVIAVSTRKFDQLESCIASFLQENAVSEKEIKKGFIGFNLSAKSNLDLEFDTFCYTDYAGRHFSSSAFGLHLATHYLMIEAEKGDKVLLINLASSNEVGLILLQSV
jgi:hypothetical protein